MTDEAGLPGTILLIDDGGPSLVSLGAQLRESGLDVIERSGSEVMGDAFAEQVPDACVLATSGEGAFAHLSALRQDLSFRTIPVIVVGVPSNRAPVLDLPMIDFLPESATTEQIVARLRASLEVSQLIVYGQRRTERLTSLLEIARALNSSLDSSAILYTITRKLSETMALVRCSFIVPDLAKGVGRVIACKDDPNIQSLEINLDNYPEIIMVLRSGERVVIDDVETDPIMAGVRKFADVFRGQSIMTLPLKNFDEIIGVLQIRKKGGQRGFADREIEYCELLANAAANALKNAQIYEDIEKHNSKLRRQKRELEQLSSELRQKNQELIDLQQLKQDFTAMVVHDLRTPLMIVQGVLDLLHYKHHANASEKELIDDGLSTTRKMLTLICNLLDVSKLESGELLLTPEDVDVATLMQEVVAPFRVLERSGDIALQLTIDESLETVRADRKSLHQILDNLLSNAFKFTPNGGRVTVRAERHPHDARGIRLIVEDTGQGVPVAEQRTIFKRFRQGKAGSHQGSGLGLNIIDLLATTHGGSVELESEPGKGARFSVTLPSLPGNPTPQVTM